MNKINEFENKIVLGDAIEILDKIDPGTIDIVLTDPPYFLDKMDDNWDHKVVSNTKNHYAIKSLPAGMKFDPEQGRRFYKWYFNVSKKINRVLKPGGFFFSFSSPRLYHRMASAIDDADFLIRDCFIWLYTQNQVKAMSLNHFIDKLSISKEDKAKLKQKLSGWKTPQIKSCFEPIVMAQKKYDGTFLHNVITHGVGLVNTNVRIGKNMFPSNVMAIEHFEELIDKYFLIDKPSKKEKGESNNHKTVKPLKICEYLLMLSGFSEDTIVLDPFIGSGTTAIAAKKLGFKYIGIDINKEYVEMAQKRLRAIKLNSLPFFGNQSSDLPLLGTLRMQP
jgi:site-specific DNA-methyltransferase (adenine-specific)